MSVIKLRSVVSKFLLLFLIFSTNQEFSSSCFIPKDDDVQDPEKINKIVSIEYESIECIESSARNCFKKNDTRYDGEIYTCNGASMQELETLNPKTQKIEIFYTAINQLSPSLLSLYPNLISITIKFCNILDIEDDTFSNNPKLQYVTLSDNKLEKVRAASFKDMTSLHYLDISFNNIKIIEDDIFSNTPNLRDLRISGNQLECFNFKGLENMQVIVSDHMENFNCSKEFITFAKENNIRLDYDQSWDRRA